MYKEVLMYYIILGVYSASGRECHYIITGKGMSDMIRLAFQKNNYCGCLEVRLEEMKLQGDLEV